LDDLEAVVLLEVKVVGFLKGPSRDRTLSSSSSSCCCYDDSR
jgi:hypothetical protein